MLDMPRPRPPLLQRETSRHGRTVWYVRKGDGPRFRVAGEFGTPEFQAAYKAAYDAAMAGTVAEPKRPAARTMHWLADRYRETTAWQSLSPATRRQRDNVLKRVLSTCGDEPLEAIDREAVRAGIERRQGKPGAQRHFVQTMRGLFAWALEAQHIAVDPTEGVKPPSGRTSATGHIPWSEDELAAYEARWPRGTRQRVWLDVLIYTGLRRSDAVRLGRQHVRGDVATLRTAKTGTEVTIRLLPPLLETLAAGPTGDLAYVAGANGGPLTKETFGNKFREACDAAGVKRSAHGLRKVAAMRASEAGATGPELDALFGWTDGGKTSAIYIAAANRKRLALNASTKLMRTEDGHSIPAPVAGLPRT